MKFQTYGDNIAVKRKDDGMTTANGVYRGLQKEKPILVEVLDIGDEAISKLNFIEVGDTILIQKYAGVEVDIDGEEILFIKPSEILAKINEE